MTQNDRFFNILSEMPNCNSSTVIRAGTRAIDPFGALRARERVALQFGRPPCCHRHSENGCLAAPKIPGALDDIICDATRRGSVPSQLWWRIDSSVISGLINEPDRPARTGRWSSRHDHRTSIRRSCQGPMGHRRQQPRSRPRRRSGLHHSRSPPTSRRAARSCVTTAGTISSKTKCAAACARSSRR